jgi:hypothetical protein
MDKKLRLARERLIKKCSLNVKLKNAWSNYDCSSPKINCNDIASILREIEEVENTLWKPS